MWSPADTEVDHVTGDGTTSGVRAFAGDEILVPLSMNLMCCMCCWNDDRDPQTASLLLSKQGVPAFGRMGF